ncbi:helix-turn-helix domain-containing protein [Leeuwenhoekiella parthenopeia]|uniref:Helix-turn-helix domain-containing protein n=1 Tax=Leeuwenhoekiella parthenopeia TaxID=2890320 RepID=A0ABS8GMU1_9FLAO|nr:helix-turn-helix domain-containing protein [Leeuwenhoekiella parthenopeia]MCC4211290.1 helix-turn-helix domain-containing protein [Leeuwenhoekiella parthenopeia]
METEFNTNDDERISLIKKMIIEMGRGNLNYRIPTTTNDDEIEAITVLINMLADKLSEYFENLYLIQSRKTYEHLIDIGFVLDEDYNIQGVTSSYKDYIPIKKSRLIGMQFKELLDKESQDLWSKAIAEINKFPKKLNLNLKGKKKLKQPITFFLNELYPKESKSKFLLTGVRTVNIREHLDSMYSESEGENHYKNFLDLSDSVLKNEEDISIIKQIHAHIEKNISESLGSLQELAHEFGTNEFKLKNGFKELYGITVFKFQMEERLNYAKTLVESSSIPLKSIAVMMGFKTSSHFSRSFKNHFGSTPRELRKAGN